MLVLVGYAGLAVAAQEWSGCEEQGLGRGPRLASNGTAKGQPFTETNNAGSQAAMVTGVQSKN